MRNRLVQIALSVGLLALLIQVVLIAPSQIRDADSKAAVLPTPDLTKDEGVDQSIKDMHMIETQDGGKEWELWSDRARSLNAQELLELDAVRATFYADSGVTFNVTGKKGSVQVKTKDLKVMGDVVIRSSNGYVFRTSHMEYGAHSKLLRTDAPVEMIGPRDAKGGSLRLTGTGMEASSATNKMDVLKDVRAEKTLEDGRKAFIRSHKARFSARDRSARFQGDVVLDLDSMRITGPEARFEYDSGKSLVKSVAFSGGARVSDADKWATAQNVRVDFDDNKFVFRGNPRVVQNNDELRGEEIVFLDGGKRVQVRGARAKVDEKRLERSR